MSDQEPPSNVRQLFKVAKLTPTAEVRKLLQRLLDDIDKEGFAPDRCVVLLRVNHADRKGYSQQISTADGDADFTSTYELIGFIEAMKTSEFLRAYSGEHHAEDEKNPVAEPPPEEPPKKEE